MPCQTRRFWMRAATTSPARSRRVRWAGLLNVRNTLLPSLQGDGQQQGALNILAQQVADRVNQILTSGTTTSGAPGTALFTYSSPSPVDVAATLAVNPAITASGLAPRNASGANAAALQLVEPGRLDGAGETRSTARP